MYSDDIWNLVLTTKSYNSFRSNSIFDNKIIERLEARNRILINYVSDVYKKDIIEAIDGNYFENLFDGILACAYYFIFQQVNLTLC